MQEEAVREARHFHGWLLTTVDGQPVYVALPGTYALDMTVRRHAKAAAGGDRSRVLVLACRDDTTCPEVTAMVS